MYLTVNKLIARLEDFRDEGYGDAPLRVAVQESWPLSGVAASMAYIEGDDIDRPDAVWIAVSNAPYDESPYAPRAAWEEW